MSMIKKLSSKIASVFGKKAPAPAKKKPAAKKAPAKKPVTKKPAAKKTPAKKTKK